MAITLTQAKNAASAGAVASLSAVFDSTPTAGNLLVCCANSDDGSVTMTSSGWSLAVSAISDVGLFQWWKVAGASESATVTVTPNTSTSVAMRVEEWDGDGVPSLDKTASATPGPNQSTISSGTTAATTVADELAVAAYGWNDVGTDRTADSYSNSFAEVAELHGIATIDVFLAVAEKTLTATGAQSSTATMSGVVQGPCSGLIATYSFAPGGVAFETISNTTVATRTNTTVTAPSGIADGDLLLGLHLSEATSPGVVASPPGGWAVVPGYTVIDVADAGLSYQFRAHYKIASGESGSYTWTHASSFTQGMILRISGADPTTPFSPAPTSNGDATSADSTATGLTTPVDGCLIVVTNTDNGDTANNLAGPTGTTPTFTERLDVTVFGAWTGVLAAAGSTGDKTFANNANTGSMWGASMFSIQPAAEGEPPAAPTLIVTRSAQRLA